MAFSIFGLGIGWIILIIVVVLVISAIFFRRYFSALVLDVGEGGLSFVDEVFGGAVMFDWGDWIAALIIFKKEKKITGTSIAIIAAIEAANFIPVLDYITNFIPAVFILRLMFNKFRPAEKKEKKLVKLISIAEQSGIDVRKQKKVLKDVKKLIKKSDPVDALKEFRSKKPVKKVSSKIRTYVDGLISDTNNIIQYIYKQNPQAPGNMMDILKQGIKEAKELLQEAQSAEENGDFQTAIYKSHQAKDTINYAAQSFDNTFQMYQSQLQQNPQFQPGNP